MQPELKIYNDVEQLTCGFAEHLSDLISQSANGNFNITLSGGSTPKKIFDIISSKYTSYFDWRNINLWWGDERCVPPDDPESNYGMTERRLISKIDIPEQNIFRIFGENDPGEESKRYGKLICENVNSLDGTPVFDLIILGLGSDGHIASIFPDQIHLFDSTDICETAIHPDTGQKRITITGKVINHAKNVFILISGNTKSNIVRNVINDEMDNKLPVEYISPLAGNYIWFLDKNAASELEL
jgi:6-phosphogluconolactonase